MPLFKCVICGEEFKAKANKNKKRMYSRECFKTYKSSLRYPNDIRMKDGYAEMIINSRNFGTKIALIDIDDIEKIRHITWGYTKNKRSTDFYVRGKQLINGKWVNINLHRYITDCPNGLQVDHINRDTFDNRKQNLRICSRSENSQNKGVTVNKKNRLKGAYKSSCGSNKWHSTLIYNKKSFWLGTFNSELEAHNAYVNTKKKHNIICKETLDI